MHVRHWPVPLLALLAACSGGEAETTGAEAPIRDFETTATPAGPGSGESNLFAAEDGTVYLSWIEPTSEGRHALRFSTWQDTGWSAPRTIAEGADWFVNWADFPSLVALPDGRLAAHWLVRSGPATYAYDVHLAVSEDGGATWSESVVPHDDGTQSEHGFVTLFPWTDGRLGAVWLDGRETLGGSHDAAPTTHGGATTGGDPATDGEPTGMTLRFAALAPGGAGLERGENVLLDGLTCDCCQTDAAVAASGAVVVYRDRSADEIRDIFVVRHVDGRWTEPRPVHDDGWRIPACPVNGPAIDAADADVAVAWFTAAQDSPRVYLAFSADTARSFAPPIRVDDGEPVGRVDVRLLDDGSALVTWLENEGDAAQVRARRVAPGGAPAGEGMVLAQSSAARASGFPRTARAGDALFLTWTEPGEASQVRVARGRVR